MNAVFMRNIHKSFPGIKAVNGVDFIVEEGEIHGLDRGKWRREKYVDEYALRHVAT